MASISRGFLSGILGAVLSKRFSIASSKVNSDKGIDVVELQHLKESVHQVLRPRDIEHTPPFEEMFSKFVDMNRADGVNPKLDENVGAVAYSHRDLVPMQGDLYWSNGRTISRQEIDKQFKNLEL